MATPFMNLTLPVVGVTLDPLWSNELNQALTTIDGHNHTNNLGALIPTAGISINADLALNGYNLSLARSLRLSNQSSPLAGTDDVVSLYASGNNLYYNNAAGQQVQITQGAGLNAASVGGFGGDYGTSTASAFYTSASSTFTFWQAPNLSAIMDVGPLVLHPTASIAFGITFKAPTGLATSYTLNLPSALPASKKILTVDASGSIDDAYDVDGSTIVVTGNTLLVPTAGITTTQIAPATIVGANLASDIDLPGTAAKVGGQNIITQASNTTKGVSIIRGGVEGTTGNPVSGEGFTCFRASLGRYRVTFNTPFDITDAPVVTATLVSTPFSFVVRIVHVESISNTSFDVGVIDGSGNPQDSNFFFTVMSVL